MATKRKLVMAAPVYVEALDKAIKFGKVIILRYGSVACPIHEVMLIKKIINEELAFTNFDMHCPIPECKSIFSFSERK